MTFFEVRLWIKGTDLVFLRTTKHSIQLRSLKDGKNDLITFARSIFASCGNDLLPLSFHSRKGLISVTDTLFWVWIIMSPILENLCIMHLVMLSERRLSWGNSGIRKQKGRGICFRMQGWMWMCLKPHCLFANPLQGLPLKACPAYSNNILFPAGWHSSSQLQGHFFEVEFHLCFDAWMYLNEQNVLSHH